MSTSPITSGALATIAESSLPRRTAVSRTPLPAAARADTLEPAKPGIVTLRDAAHGAQRSALVAALLARVPAADRRAATTAIPAILEAARRTGTTDPNRIGYLLATAQTESDFGANMTESGHDAQWFNAAYGCSDGNRPGTGDGYTYRGRGYVQTTRAGRYAELSRSLGLPDVAIFERGKTTLEPALVAHPEKLAQPDVAAEALVVGVQKNLFTHNPAAALDTTIPAGKKPGDVDFYHARGIVNGIVKDQAVTVATHATIYARILAGFRESVLGAAAR
jgi:predicted chitinase